jgi:hypothetical protein
VADGQSERQARQQQFVATTPQRILSDEQLQYTTQVPKFQAQSQADPYLNGADALRRLRGEHGG